MLLMKRAVNPSVLTESIVNAIRMPSSLCKTKKFVLSVDSNSMPMVVSLDRQCRCRIVNILISEEAGNFLFSAKRNSLSWIRQRRVTTYLIWWPEVDPTPQGRLSPFCWVLSSLSQSVRITDDDINLVVMNNRFLTVIQGACIDRSFCSASSNVSPLSKWFSC